MNGIGHRAALSIAEALAGPTPPLVIDVREPWECALAPMPGALNIPLGELPERFQTLDPAAETVLVCHHGIRSMHAAMFLAAEGFSRVFNMTGGIDAWSAEVDPSVPRY